jgi:3-oxoacyl-[acyl-carrier protein] reductase
MIRERLRPPALVMASSRGIGFAVAQTLCKRETPVAICGRTADQVDAAVTKLSELGTALGLVGDVGDIAQLATIVTKARAELGPIGTLVANTGGPPSGGFEDVSPADWDRAYRSTVGSFVESVRLVLPDMRELGAGRIILIASSSIRRPIPNLVLSNTFRPALNGLAKDLAVSLAREHITVNVVAPGRIDTERVRDLDRASAQRQNISVESVQRTSECTIPMGRYGRTEELSALVEFLASPEAGYITGQSIVVDGGLTASLP